MKIIKPRAIIFDWNGTLVYNNDENKVLLLPNVVKVLKKIYSMNIFISIISNTATVFLNKKLTFFNIHKYFFNVIGTKSDIEYRKPDKKVVDYALLGMNIDDVNIDTVWMVGNSFQDVETAYNANIKPVIFGEKLLNKLIFDNGLKSNTKSIFVRNHLELYKKLEEIESEST